MAFRIQGLRPGLFQHLWHLPEAELARHRARRILADSTPGYPDRIGLRDAEPGESLLLVNFEHLAADTPYRASHAVYVVEGATERFDRIDEVPLVLRRRLLSLRGFDAEGMMRDADVVEGTAVETAIEHLFANPAIQHIHAHYAKPGCFAALVERAGSERLEHPTAGLRVAAPGRPTASSRPDRPA